MDLSRQNLMTQSKPALIELAKEHGFNPSTTLTKSAIIDMIIPPSEDQEQEDNQNNFTQKVLSFLRPDEVVDGHPSCDGLRRAFENLFGSIIESCGKIVQAPNAENNDRAAVEFRIKFIKNGEDFTRMVGDGADVCWVNTKKPFSNYPVATAMTVAEGRCLRKAMGLKLITMEELIAPTGEEAEVSSLINDSHAKIQEQHKNTILRLCERLGISIDKMLSFYDDVKAKTISDCTAFEGKFLINLLNKFSQKILVPPSEILS